MKTSSLNSQENRSFVIDFDFYTDGDVTYKKELIDLMKENIKELKYGQQHAYEQNDPVFFLRLCHKINSTLTILNHSELMFLIKNLSHPAVIFDDEKRRKHIHSLNVLCDEIITGLENEGINPSTQQK